MKNLILPDNTPRRLAFYLAMEEYAAKKLPPGDYFFAWRVAPTVICGRNQEIDKEVDIAYCRAEDIDIVRRKSGGGAVYADMNNWMFSYITPSDEVASIFSRYTTMIAAMLSSLGFNAIATGRNDIVIDEKKVSGNAFYHIPGRSIVHGTMLCDIDNERMSRAITPSRAKLESKAVKSVQSRITSLKAEGLKLSIEEFGAYATDFVTQGDNLVLTADQISDIEAIEMSYYKPDYFNDHHRRHNIKADNKADIEISKHIDGVGELDITIILDGKRQISALNISGDFFVLADMESTLISKLKGIRYTKEDIEIALANIDTSKIIAGLSKNDLINILVKPNNTMQETKKTCLHSRHCQAGAQMAPFAGYDMPIEYEGLDAEHTAVRTHVGVFDVSHMGEVDIDGPEATSYVNHIFTGDVSTMHDGQALYGMMCNENGGVVDDLLVYRKNANSYMLVINAANIDKDLAWINARSASFDVNISDRCVDFGQLALQGPDSEQMMKSLLGIDGSDLSFYTFKTLDDGTIVSRTGYTGEDGFEIYAKPEAIVDMWDKLMAGGVPPCGLGCRDTLRFEAGLPLYGDELTDDITPLEAGLGMFVKLDKPNGFIGSDALKIQKAEGLKRKLVGLQLDGGATARHGFEVLDNDANVIGYITTGYNSLTLGKNIAMALVDAKYSALDSKVEVRIRRKTTPAVVIKKRFYTPNYKK